MNLILHVLAAILGFISGVIFGKFVGFAYRKLISTEIEYAYIKKPPKKVKERKPKAPTYNQSLTNTLIFKLIKKNTIPTKEAIKKEGVLFGFSSSYSGNQRLFYFKQL